MRPRGAHARARVASPHLAREMEPVSGASIPRAPSPLGTLRGLFWVQLFSLYGFTSASSGLHFGSSGSYFPASEAEVIMRGWGIRGIEVHAVVDRAVGGCWPSARPLCRPRASRGVHAAARGARLNACCVAPPRPGAGVKSRSTVTGAPRGHPRGAHCSSLPRPSLYGSLCGPATSSEFCMGCSGVPR